LRVELVSACYLLRNGWTYCGKIWHADAIRHWPTLGLGLLSIGVIAGKKITILFQFSNGKQLAAAGAGWAALQRPAAPAAACAAGRSRCWATGLAGPHCRQRPGAAGYGLSHIPIHYAHKSETEREARYTFTGWSAQCDRHGAFKLKPSEARFQPVH